MFYQDVIKVTCCIYICMWERVKHILCGPKNLGCLRHTSSLDINVQLSLFNVDNGINALQAKTETPNTELVFYFVTS